MKTAFGVLGPLVVRDAAGTEIPLGGQKPRELLAALLLQHGQLLSVDRLVDCLWGERAPAGAATTLRTYVKQVRQVLERAGAAAGVESRSGGYVLGLDPTELDAERFEELLRQGQAAADRGEAETVDALLGDALSLWRGELLADLGRPEYAVAPAARLDELRLVAWEGWLDAQLELGRHRSVVTRLQALVDDHPFRERFSAQLMIALYRSGRQADALAVSASTRLRLADELGLDPGPELRELETSVLQQSPRLEVVDNGRVPRQRQPATPAYSDLELLERENERATLIRLVAGVAEGRGGGVAVAGDAGSGKSTLVQVACADGPRVRLLRGSCDPLSTPRPLGPLRDVARDAGIASLVQGDEVVLPRLCEEVYAALAIEPTVLVVEDIHWIDAASVDVLRFLARRIQMLPLGLVVTYRDHEIDHAHPARRLLGELAGGRGHEVLELQPLSEQAVRSLVDGSALEARRIHQLTGGNPFFVTEVTKDLDRPLPATVRDAVLARTVEIGPEDFEVLQLVATAPDRLDDRVLPVLGVDPPALRRLEVTGLLSRSRGGLVYRHELARQAIESTIPTGGGPRLHQLLLDALERVGGHEPAVLTHHAVAAHDAARAVEHARAAAEESTRAGAHGEAAAFLEIALLHHRDAPPQERAELLQRLSFEQYLTSHLSAALDSLQSAIPLWQAVGDRRGLATAHETSAVFEYYNAHRREAETHAEQATAIARDTGATREQSSAFATLGFLAYFRHDVAVAREGAAEAARLAEVAADPFLTVRAQVVGGLADLAAGSTGARDRLLELFRVARSHGWDELASTIHSQLAFMDVEHRRIGSAEQILAEALPFTMQRELPICAHWQRAQHARVHFARGHWPTALSSAEEVLQQAGMPVAMVWPSIIAALLPLRRGESDVAGPALEDAWRLTIAIDEPLRRLGVLSALAEAAWMTGVPDPRLTEQAGHEVDRLVGVPGAEWAVGEMAAWLARLRLLEAPPPQVAEPFRLAFEGRYADAAAWWGRNGEPFAQAMVLGDSPDEDDRARAVLLLEQLGAAGTAARVRRTLRRTLRHSDREAAPLPAG
jgi:DNA-binding SARP family transcriptional activator/tetratricopeptide (TPR) repeat protein